MSGVERLDLGDAATLEQVLEVQLAAHGREAEVIRARGNPHLHDTVADPNRARSTWDGVRVDGRVVAAVAWSVSGRTVTIEELVVHPAMHRRGLGRRLLRHVLAAHEDADVIEVTTRTGNTPAEALYESAGFRFHRLVHVAPGVTSTHHERWHPKFARSFDADVAAYEAARPGYPPELFDRLAEVGLRPGARVLEIGPGPGTVTAELLARGSSVVAVEPGVAMCARLRERFAGGPVEVVESSFEEATIGGSFDLAVAATSLHWVDLTVGLPKLAQSLPTGACLAAVWNVHAPVTDGPLEVALREVIDAHVPVGDHHTVPYPRDVDARRTELTRGGWFEMVEHRRFDWTLHHDGRSLRALFATMSDVSTLPEPARRDVLERIERLVDGRFGGSVDRACTTELYLARRLAS